MARAGSITQSRGSFLGDCGRCRRRLARRHYGPASSVVLFSPADDSLPTARLQLERPLQHSDLRDLIISAADDLGYAIG